MVVLVFSDAFGVTYDDGSYFIDYSLGIVTDMDILRHCLDYAMYGIIYQVVTTIENLETIKAEYPFHE